MLDLIQSDVCDPFSVRTPYGKLYFIVFLDRYTHLVNVQLLVSNDQALKAWKIVRALWENHIEHKVKVFCSDNCGEFLGSTFKQNLQDTGICHKLSSPYAYQQSGKAE